MKKLRFWKRKRPAEEEDDRPASEDAAESSTSDTLRDGLRYEDMDASNDGPPPIIIREPDPRPDANISLPRPMSMMSTTTHVTTTRLNIAALQRTDAAVLQSAQHHWTSAGRPGSLHQLPIQAPAVMQQLHQRESARFEAEMRQRSERHDDDVREGRMCFFCLNLCKPSSLPDILPNGSVEPSARAAAADSHLMDSRSQSQPSPADRPEGAPQPPPRRLNLPPCIRDDSPSSTGTEHSRDSLSGSAPSIPRRSRSQPRPSMRGGDASGADDRNESTPPGSAPSWHQSNRPPPTLQGPRPQHGFTLGSWNQSAGTYQPSGQPTNPQQNLGTYQRSSQSWSPNQFSSQPTHPYQPAAGQAAVQAASNSQSQLAYQPANYGNHGHPYNGTGSGSGYPQGSGQYLNMGPNQGSRVLMPALNSVPGQQPLVNSNGLYTAQNLQPGFYMPAPGPGPSQSPSHAPQLPPHSSSALFAEVDAFGRLTGSFMHPPSSTRYLPQVDAHGRPTGLHISVSAFGSTLGRIVRANASNVSHMSGPASTLAQVPNARNPPSASVPTLGQVPNVRNPPSAPAPTLGQVPNARNPPPASASSATPAYNYAPGSRPGTVITPSPRPRREELVEVIQLRGRPRDMAHLADRAIMDDRPNIDIIDDRPVREIMDNQPIDTGYTFDEHVETMPLRKYKSIFGPRSASPSEEPRPRRSPRAPRVSDSMHHATAGGMLGSRAAQLPSSQLSIPQQVRGMQPSSGRGRGGRGLLDRPRSNAIEPPRGQRQLDVNTGRQDSPRPTQGGDRRRAGFSANMLPIVSEPSPSLTEEISSPADEISPPATEIQEEDPDDLASLQETLNQLRALEAAALRREADGAEADGGQQSSNTDEMDVDDEMSASEGDTVTSDDEMYRAFLSGTGAAVSRP